jgi:hypothetical protein
MLCDDGLTHGDGLLASLGLLKHRENGKTKKREERKKP